MIEALFTWSNTPAYQTWGTFGATERDNLRLRMR
jgi:hypothetical protein